MDTGPAIPAHRALPPSPLGERDAARERLKAQVALLDRLAEFGVQIVEAMARQLAAPAGGPFAMLAPKLFQGDIALAYVRVARAVRLTLTLQSKLIDELHAWTRGEPPQAPAPARAAEADGDCDSKPEPEAEPQEGAEAVERLGGATREARDDIYVLLDRPVGEVIDLICRDLGVSPEWVRQAQAAGPLPEETELDDFGQPLMGWATRPSEKPWRPPPERWSGAAPRPRPSTGSG